MFIPDEAGGYGIFIIRLGVVCQLTRDIPPATARAVAHGAFVYESAMWPVVGTAAAGGFPGASLETLH